MIQASLLREFWYFMRVRKKWWLIPIIIMMLIFGMVFVLAEGSVLAPLIYTMF